MAKNLKNSKKQSAPRWCDLACSQASFPAQSALDGAGSCRTFSALYCARLQRLVMKNAPCQAAREISK